MPKKDFTPLCSKNSRQKKIAVAKKKFAVAKKKVAVAKKKVAVAKKDFTMRKNVAESYMLYGKGFQNGLF